MLISTSLDAGNFTRPRCSIKIHSSLAGTGDGDLLIELANPITPLHPEVGTFRKHQVSRYCASWNIRSLLELLAGR